MICCANSSKERKSHTHTEIVCPQPKVMTVKSSQPICAVCHLRTCRIHRQCFKHKTGTAVYASGTLPTHFVIWKAVHVPGWAVLCSLSRVLACWDPGAACASHEQSGAGPTRLQCRSSCWTGQLICRNPLLVSEPARGAFQEASRSTELSPPSGHIPSTDPGAYLCPLLDHSPFLRLVGMAEAS